MNEHPPASRMHKFEDHFAPRREGHHLTPQERIEIILLAILIELTELNAKEAQMVQQITNLEDAIARIEDDAKNVADNTAATKTLVAELKQEVVDLKAQLANGVPITPDQIQGFADRVDAVDVSLDANAPPVTPAEPTA